MKKTFKFLTLSRVFNDCRDTVGRLSPLILLLFTLSFGFTQQAWGASSEYGAKKILYFDVSNSNTDRWAQTNADFKFNWKYKDSDDSSENIGDTWSTIIADGSYYYTTSPDNAYCRTIQVMRMDRNNHSTQWNYSNRCKVSDRSSDKDNCIYIHSDNKDWADTWVPKWKTYVPPMKSLSIANNGTTTVSGSGSQSDPYIIAAGATIQVKAAAALQVDDSNPTFKYKYSVDGAVVQNYGSGNNTYQFTAGTEAHTYAVTVRAYATYNSVDNSAIAGGNTIYFKIATYTGLTIADNPSGYVTAASILSANQVVQGQSVTITKGTPKTGYEFKDITVTSGGTISGTTWTPSANNQTATVNWKEKTHNITISNDGNGSTDPTGEQTNVGEVTGIEITATPNQDYGFKEWIVTGGTVSSQSATTTFKPTADNATIKATFQSTAVYYDLTIGVCSSQGPTQGSISSDPAAGTHIQAGTAFTLTATPATGYEVEGWYSDAACTGAKLKTDGNTYQFTLSGNTEIYVKFKEKTFSVTVQAGTGIDQVTGGGANVGQLTGTAITATVKSGYTWSTWTGGTGTFAEGATVKDNTFRPTAASTLTATATENKTAVAVSSNNTTWGTVDKDNVSVGVTTSATLTATKNSGYKFVSWALDGGATLASGALTDATITIKGDGSSANGTAVATFAEDLSSDWKVQWHKNDAWTAEPMLHSAPNSKDVIYTIEITSSDIDKDFAFKIQGGSSWYGWGTNEGDKYTYKATATHDMYDNYGSDHDLHFKPTIAGTYTFKVEDITASTKYLTVTWPIYNCVYGDFDNWDKTAHKLNFGDGNEASTVVNITDISKSYEFLVLVNSNYYTYTTKTITRSTASEVAFAAKGGSDNNAKFTPDMAGDYTFTYNKSTNKLTITYPTLPAALTTSTEKRMFNENELSFISGDGTAADPYKIYTDEALTIDITALAAQTNLTAKYQFGEKAATTDVLSKTITNPSTEETSIVVKAFYESDGVAGTAWEKTIYYQGVPTPTIALSTMQNEYDILTAPDEVMISYRATNYSGSATITKDGDSWQTPSSASENYEDQLGQTLQTHTYVATATTNGRTFTSTLVVSVYKMVKVKVADENSLFNHFYMWRDGTDQTGKAWPGETFSYQVGTTHIFYVKYPTFDRFVLNNGKQNPTDDGAAQTEDVTILEDEACYTIGAKITEGDDKDKYACTLTQTCPNGLYVKDIDPVAALVGEGVLVSPQVDIEPGLDESSLAITFDYSQATGISCDQRGTGFMVTATQAAVGKAHTIDVTYSIEGAESVTKSVTINVTEAIMIQAKYGNLGWSDHNQIYIHYWGKGVNATINMTWKDYVGEDSNKQDRVYARIPLDSEHTINFQIYAWDMNENYKVTNDVNGVTEAGCYIITAGEDKAKRNIAKDGTGLCWTAYYVEVDMNNGTVYRSNTVESSTETVSFFAPGASETGYKQGLVRIMENGTPKGEVASPTFTTSGVYTAKILANGEGLSDVAPYTGDYYIRTDGADGHWDNYKTNADNKFIKFDKIESSTYDRYWVKNLKHADDKTNVNIQACVANDYNENLANKIVSSSYTDGNGDVFPNQNGVNVRFGYDPSTNNFERAIIMGAASDAFLNVIGDNNNVYKESECQTLLNEQNENSKFADKEQWVYEKDVFVKIDYSHTSSVAKLQSQDFNGNVMYQLGFTIDPNTGKATTTPKTFGLIAVGTDEGIYKIHLVYDFKTNRMVSGWTPEGDISGNIVLDADMLLVRKHQEAAQQIRFSNDGASISKIKHLYGVMEIEKEKMIAAQTETMYELHLYWISFPFDVKVSSIFGVGTYGKEWKLQRYDGAERASKGWFKGDGTTTFWKDMTLDETMNANEGYILSLKPAEFDEETCEIWNHGRTVAAFYFPSVLDNVGLIKADSHEQSIPEHECKIDREFEVEDVGTVNHKNTDSHWNVMGIPAFQDAVPLTSAQGFHAVYKWVPSTNTYDVQEVNNEFPLQTMYAYMVQYHGIINWTNVSVISQAPYAYADDKNYTIELFFNGNGAEDHTYVKLADGAHTDFELNEDMMKIDNAGYPNIYSFAGNYNVAYNETKMENQTVMLGVSAPKNGSYTFAMPKDFSGKAVLVDLESGEATDLNLSDYTVELNKGTYNNRFQLMLEVEAKIPTNIENANGGLWSEDGKTRKLLINDQIYLINGGRVYNATGTMVK